MKKILVSSMLLLGFISSPFASYAATYTFSPYDSSGVKSDVFDFDHYYLYLWAIDGSSVLSALKSGEVVKSATIKIDNIYNFDYNDYALKLYLLDNVNKNDNTYSVDIISLYDKQSTSPAYEIPYYDDKNFKDYIELEKLTYSRNGNSTPNPIPGPNNKTYDYSYNFDALEILTLSQYLQSTNTWEQKTYTSTFGIGIDPDCHFYNDGMKLVVETGAAPVPEPSTMLLFGAGLLGLAAVKGRKK